MSVNERKDKTGTIKEVELGLADNENQALAEMRRQIESDAELNDMRDATLARYLRNNSWAVDASIKQLREYLAWRKEKNIDKILDNPDFPNKDLIRTIVPYAYHQQDKEGRPIYIEKTGMIATAALADEKLNPLDHFMHSHIYGVEYMQRKMHEISLQRKERVNGITTILDMNGLGFHHRQCLFILKNALDFDKKYYPEYLGRLYVINTPWVAPYLYTAVQVFLDEVTKSRIQIIPGDPASFLLENIDAANLPQEFGGACTGEACNHGGFPSLVKGCVDVLDASQLKATEVSGLDDQLVSYDFEKTVEATDAPDSLFTWYFEVADGYDIDFSVELLPVSGVREEDEKKRVLVQKVERLKTGRGTFKAPFPKAKLLFRWDNNFSYFTSKTIKYTVSCIANDKEQLDSLTKATGQQEQKGQ